MLSDMITDTFCQGNITPPPPLLFPRATPTSCQANCSVTDLAVPQRVVWQPMNFSTTIVAATVTEIVDLQSNTTTITTNYNELPSGYTLPPTNQAGTHVEQVTDFRSGREITFELYESTQLFGAARLLTCI
jgi:hypothetical protein